MINQLISYLLDKIIGKYVEHFTSQNVKTGIFKGDVRLENLALKKSVLEDLFEWPVIVKSGVIGNVTLRIPYTRFRSQAWAIMIEDISIVAVSNNNWKISEKVFQNENIMKKLLLQSLEAKWHKKMTHQITNEKSESRMWLSYVASLGYRILRNIQIEVRNVHIRYEDNLTIPSQIFSTGLIINEFSMKSSDFEWESKSELKAELDVVNKEVELSGVSIYLDPHSKNFCEDVCSENIKALLQQKIEELTECDYIVKPISLHGMMSRNLNTFPMNNIPRISLHLKMKLVEVSLSQAQFRIITCLSDEIERFDCLKHHMKYRPQLSIMEAPRQWWKFAISKHIRDECKGKTLMERARNLVKYVQYYEEYLLNKDKSSELEFENELDSELDLDSLIYLREVAMERVSRKNREISAAMFNQPTQPTGWWDYLWGRRNNEVEEIIAQPLINSETSLILEKILPEESNATKQGLEQDISEILNEVDYEAVNFFTRDKIFLRGEFSLDGIRIKLLEDVENPILLIKTTNLLIGFESRPQFSSWYTRIGLRSLVVQDLSITNNETNFRDVISSMGHMKKERKEIFTLAFESNPLPKTCVPNIRKILAINSEPLTIVHCPLLIEKVQNYFSTLRSTKNIKAAAEKQIRKAKDRTRASIKNILDEGSSEIRTWISLKISAPKIIFPNYRQTQDADISCVLLDLGRLQVSNNSCQVIETLLKISQCSTHLEDESDVDSEFFVTPTSSPIGSLENLSLESSFYEAQENQVTSNIYDEYSITLDNVMCLVGTWQQMQSVLVKNASQKKDLLMEPFNLQIDMKRKCVSDKLGQFPNLILESKISKVLINISDHKLQLTKGCFQSLIGFKRIESTTDDPPERHKKNFRNDDTSKLFDRKNYKSVSASFVLHSFIVQLESKDRPLAELTLKDTKFQLARYPTLTLINVQVLDLILADARANLGSKLDFILASHKSVYTEHSLNYNPDDPIIEFSYQITSLSETLDLQHKANLMFSDLDIIANQETLIELVAFIRPVFSDNFPEVYDESKIDKSNLNKFQLLDVSVSFKIVNILLIRILPNYNYENRFAESVGKILLSNMNLQIYKNGAILSSTIRIKSVNVVDISTPDSLHRNILVLTTGKEKMNLKIGDKEDIINISIFQQNNSSPFLINGTMPHIIYVHSPEFLYAVEKCISVFQKYIDGLKHNIATVARTAILSSEKQKRNFLNNINLHLKMLSPILVLPRDKTSNQIILVNLGDIEISNITESFKIVFTDAIVMSKELSIQDSEYDISICTDNNSKFPLLDKIDLHLTISRVIETHMILIECQFSSSLSLSFSKNTYEQVLKSLNNLVYDDDNEENTAPETDTIIQSEEQNSEPLQMEIPITLISKFSQIKMELYPDSFENNEEPMLRLILEGISIEFVRTNKYIKDVELVVDQISMYQVLDFRHKRVQKLLIYSIASPNNLNMSQGKSASCPDLLEDISFPDNLDFNSSSMSRKLELDDLFDRKKSLSNSEEIFNVPFTESKLYPHSSKNNTFDKLAKINLRLIDKRIPKFSVEYDSINRFIDAHFNQLTFCVSMEPWVILLDFFGLGSKFYDPKDIKNLSDVSKVLPSFNRRYDGEIEEIINTRFNFHVEKFSLLLENESHYVNHSKLARISAIDIDLLSISKDGNLNLSGSLTDFQLTDLSPAGSIYTQRLFPASNQGRILKFKLFKYGLPDPSLLREEDIKLYVKITEPIVYIHTQRFLQELNQFFQNFLQYQDRLSHLRVTSAGRIVDKGAQRSARIRMKLSFQAPLLLFPVSAFSDHILVIDLGKFSLQNEFKFVNNDQSCLLDEMRIDLEDMDVYTVVRISDIRLEQDSDLIFPYLTVRPLYPKPLFKKCNLNLTVSRNLNCNTSHSSPDWQIFGSLSSVVFSPNIDQYRTIRGVLAHNLGENVDHLKSYKFQAFQIDPTLYTDLTGIAWLVMKIELCLNNVQLNLVSQVQNSINIENITLCRLNFLQSKLVYESYSDASKMITLACEQITVEDLRYICCPANNRLNVFQVIISPDNYSAKEQDPINNCQLYIKYSTNSDQNRFMVRLNKMKAITIFDWLHITKNWIFTPPYEIVSLAVNEELRFDNYVALYLQSKPQSVPISCQPLAIRKYYQEIIQEEFKPTHLTVDVQESRFFILEDSSQVHSLALILIVAGTCSYQTRENRPGPFSFSLSQFHLASCAMLSDTSNLLSIINPVDIRINSEEKLYVTHGKPSLDDVLHDEDSTKLKIKVEVSAFKIRLSFSDIQLLTKIIRSFPNQTVPPANVAYQTGPLRNRWSSLNIEGHSSTRISQSTLNPVQRLSKFVDQVCIHHLEQNDFVSVCLIDDCIDADVPLFDIKFNNVTIDLKLSSCHGTINSLLSVDYYNTNSFGWTPIIESWSFNIKWFWQTSLNLILESCQTLNMDISSHLLQISRNTHTKWSMELQQKNTDASTDYCKRHDNPFVPFLIDNKLGCDIRYRKLSLNNPPMYNKVWETEPSEESADWISVPADSDQAPLVYDMEQTARDKIRYDSNGAHFNTSHRIELELEGWSNCQPITVDKLGVFYRHLQKKQDIEVHHIRIVIEIVRQGSVQNKIIIRSPLQLTNALNVPLEVKFTEKSSSTTSHSILDPNSTIAIPLFYVLHNIQIKPISLSHDKSVSPKVIDCLFYSPLDYSENLFSWWNVKQNGQKMESEVICSVSKSHFNAEKSKSKVYLICSIERLNFPLVPKGLPAHNITISAPFSLFNKLPCDMRFAMKTQSYDNGQSTINEALVQPSRICTVLTTSMKQSTYFSVYLDSFPRCDPLLIHGDIKLNHAVLLRVYDEQNRLLELEVKVESRPSGPVSVIISAIYWIINRTSLPLVFAQSSEIDTLAAGHLPENEEASSSTPLLFNFPNKNESFTLRVRLGNKAKLANMERLIPLWSDKVPLEKIGTTTIQLRAAFIDHNRPHLLYNLGLEVRSGRGKHCDTKIVIFTARYLLDNRSSNSLYFLQYNCKSDQSKPIMALPGSFLTFHWPREDLDKLLAVQKLDDNNHIISQVSGGFQIEKCNSFYIYLRGVDNYQPSQLRVTISLQGAQYRVVFTDVGDLPSPYKLENLTYLQVFFFQIVPESSSTKHSILPPKSCISYALDEPTFDANINLCIDGGTQFVYNINDVGPGLSLYYDNFLYIVLNHKCQNESDSPLVFDVLQNSKKVFLNSKSSVSRSQLWYYSSDNELFHEGSIAPHNQKQKIDRSGKNHLLLDVDILAPCPSISQKRMYRMILAKADPRRDKYQKWYFTDDGCLVNKIGMKCYINAYCKNAAVFGGFEILESYYCPLIKINWFRPGSGEVMVSVITDGPTRVLRLIDKSDEVKQLRLSIESSGGILSKTKTPSIEMTFDLNGIGIFLINHLPEELLYAVCNNIHLQWIRESKKDKVDIKIGEIQIDNQQMDASFPCVMYKENKTDETVSDDSAFCLSFEKDIGHPYNVLVFSYLKMYMASMCVILEEKMLLKTMQMFWTSPNESELLEEDFSSLQHYAHIYNGRQFYFENLIFDTGIISLSVITTISLSSDLKNMKKLFPSLMSFTNAQIVIDPYSRHHVFETSDLIIENIIDHYRKQLKSQAIKIFGSVDFLGNPIGFISDITSGMKRLYSDKDVSNMFKHLVHGIGDSTAKICSSASRLISEITMDPEYEENRQKLFEVARISGSNTAQVTAGFKSLGYGLLGAIKSVPTQLDKGYKNEGPSGLFIGALKGIVGVVTKPVGGMLDFATVSATGFREIARSSKEGQPPRRYDPRCLSSSWKLLPFHTAYSNNLVHTPLSNLTQAQKLLAKFSNSSASVETVFGFLVIQNSKESQLKVIVSDVSVHIIKTVNGESNLLKHYPLLKLSSPPISVQSKPSSNSLYIKFNYIKDISEYQAASRPTFKCDTELVAKQLVKLVCEAHCDYLERQMTYNNKS